MPNETHESIVRRAQKAYDEYDEVRNDEEFMDIETPMLVADQVPSLIHVIRHFQKENVKLKQRLDKHSLPSPVYGFVDGKLSKQPIGKQYNFSQVIEANEWLRKNKMCLMINPINQIENGYEEQVAKGEMPLVTYTAIIYDDAIENIIADMSLDSLNEAISWSLDYIETLSHPRGKLNGEIK